MEETRPETENRMEIENRIRNLVWTVSGDYTLEVRPDVERFGREKYCALMTVSVRGRLQNGLTGKRISFIWSKKYTAMRWRRR